MLSEILKTRLDRGLAVALVCCSLLALVLGALAVQADLAQQAPRQAPVQAADVNPALQVGQR